MKIQIDRHDYAIGLLFKISYHVLYWFSILIMIYASFKRQDRFIMIAIFSLMLSVYWKLEYMRWSKNVRERNNTNTKSQRS